MRALIKEYGSFELEPISVDEPLPTKSDTDVQDNSLKHVLI